jgi:hypothetical protein
VACFVCSRRNNQCDGETLRVCSKASPWPQRRNWGHSAEIVIHRADTRHSQRNLTNVEQRIRGPNHTPLHGAHPRRLPHPGPHRKLQPRRRVTSASPGIRPEETYLYEIFGPKGWTKTGWRDTVEDACHKAWDEIVKHQEENQRSRDRNPQVSDVGT